MSNNTRKNLCVKLSIAPVSKPGDGATVNFTIHDIPVSRLEETFKKNNYSPIQWTGNYRKADNFESATGFVVDIENSIIIEEAVERLEKANVNYALITSRSHKDDSHRFHILIPFQRIIRTAADYDRARKLLVSGLFPEADPKTFHYSQQFFASPEGAIYRYNWNGKNYDTDAGLERISNAWNDSLTVKLENGREIPANTVSVKTEIHCPFHDDESASAFINKATSGNLYIYCSSCAKTYWMEETPVPVDDRLQSFYSYQKEILEMGIAGGVFFMHEITKEKFFELTGAVSKEDKESVFRHLMQHKHIRHLKDVEQTGDARIEKPEFHVDNTKAAITVRYGAIPAIVKDNAYIEKYLEMKFGEYKCFIKEYMAAYCYTNYRKLPVLVFTGDRNTGKNTFAELLLEIFQPISLMWHGKQKNFNSEAEMKLLIADESVSDNRTQYQMLKQYGGQKYATINKKYAPEYSVRNNVNIIILSNAKRPIFVEREELPTDERRNQFFVFEFQEMSAEPDNEMATKLKDRIGHYIRTELKMVYDRLEQNGYRYTIKVPITKWEKALFRNNVTEVEAMADSIIDRYTTDLEKAHETDTVHVLFQKGFIPTEYFSEIIMPRGITRQDVVRNMVDGNLLELSEVKKFQLKKGDRKPCYAMSEKLRDRITNELKQLSVQCVQSCPDEMEVTEQRN